MSVDAALEKAIREHSRLVARATFWERWRTTLLLPLLLLAIGSGFLLGWMLRTQWSIFPERTEYFLAAISAVVSGRLISGYFAERKLVAARHKMENLRRLQSQKISPIDTSNRAQ